MTSGPRRAPAAADRAGRGRNRWTARLLLLLPAGMLALSFASVPLYRVFCRATGFGGTPQFARSGPVEAGHRVLTVRFDANVAPGLPWRFEPETAAIDIRTGTTATVYFRVRNLVARDTAANAEYNISPDVGGFYFNKVSCFCFSEQHLGPDETAELPVVFFLDPALEKDETMRKIDTLTLSYTLHRAQPSASVAVTGGTATAPSADRKL